MICSALRLAPPEDERDRAGDDDARQRSRHLSIDVANVAIPGERGSSQGGSCESCDSNRESHEQIGEDVGSVARALPSHHPSDDEDDTDGDSQQDDQRNDAHQKSPSLQAHPM